MLFSPLKSWNEDTYYTDKEEDCHLLLISDFQSTDIIWHVYGKTILNRDSEKKK